jgi:hypothetical protein
MKMGISSTVCLPQLDKSYAQVCAFHHQQIRCQEKSYKFPFHIIIEFWPDKGKKMRQGVYGGDTTPTFDGSIITGTEKSKQ